MTIAELKTLMDSGDFHHATYRNQGTLWEGLHIYARHSQGFRGYEHAGAFLKDSPELKQASELTCGTGISLGAYGRG
jgi:hypothetical protein